MAQEPKVSVVMSVFNGEKFLEETMMSILAQTLSDFEFIVVDDGSTDRSGDMLDEFAARDSRIVVTHQANSGLIPAINVGCKMARGEYIARMDADDISLPRRLEKQADFLDKNPRIGILDTWVENIDENGDKIGEWRAPTDPRSMAWLMLFFNPIRQSSVMIRKSLLEKLNYYSEDIGFLEDYYLWARALDIAELSCLPEILSKIRYYSTSRSKKNVEEKRRFVDSIIASMVERELGRPVSPERVRYFYQVGRRKFENKREIADTRTLILELLAAFKNNRASMATSWREIDKMASNTLIEMASTCMSVSIGEMTKNMIAAVALFPPYLWNRLPFSFIRLLRGARENS